MSLKLEELVGKRLTEEQFDEAAGKKDACYHKVKARYDVWPSAYASGALVKCRKVGAKNWGNKSKKEGIEEKMRPAIKKALAQKGYGPIFNAIETSKQQLKQLRYSRGEIQDTLIDMFGDEDPKILKKIKEGVDEAKYKGYDYKRQKRKDGLSLIVPALRKSFSNMKDLKKYIDKHGKMESVKEAMSPKVKRMMMNAINDEAAMDDFLKKYGKSIPKSQDRNIVRYRDDIRDAEMGYGDAEVSKKYLMKIFKKYIKESVNEKRGTCWVGYQQVGMKKKGGKMVPNCVKEVYDIYWEENGKGHGYTFEHIIDDNLFEAEYQGRKVKLGKPMQGDTKKFKVYVKNPKGNVVKVNFGQGGDAKGGTMRIRKDNPKARKSFRARHNCDNPGPRHKARYWSCKKW